ncbi:hypothetical protein K438DRAFT_1932445 [Mycena galopus ATCC 62051]|nr:hypothetical protein K438DRAFT_1932445 [Mycena galopus ATCC 62051]
MPKTRSNLKKPSHRRYRDNLDRDREDILISIKTPHMNNIAARSKNHEFRKYLVSRTVQRMWLYVSSPDQTLRYIAIVSQGKVPGEIGEGDSGLGNADFNNGGPSTNIGGARYAYEILHLYKLRQPLHISVLGEQYSISPPQRYMYTPRQLLDDVKLKDQEMLF